jgi:ribosomal protein S18 acetylase RimI-like enzyme
LPRSPEIELPAAPPPFTGQGYRALLETLLARGYRVRDYAEADPEAPDLLLRHDLDMSLAAALPLAEIEHRLGLRSTYFLRVASEYYNPYTRTARTIMERLIGLGHAIGLHFDAAPYAEGDFDALERAAARECEALEELTGGPVTMLSFHRPAPRLFGLDRAIGGRDHAYRPRYVAAMGYCSDSRGAWHHGHPLAHPAVAAGTALQLLTHPIWWSGAAGEPPLAKLERFLAGRLEALRRELASDCEPYRHRGDEIALGTARTVSGSPAATTFRTLHPEHIRGDPQGFLAVAADVPGEYWTAEHFLVELAEKWRLSFAAWIGGRPAGYAVLSRKSPERIHLHHFGVAPDHRRTGLGRRMAAEMEARARRSDSRWLTLKVAAANTGAQRFYRRRGFRLVDAGGSYWLYRKDLASARAVPGGRR